MIATDAVSLKRFFRARYGIPVRVRTGTGKAPYIGVWIAMVQQQPGGPLRYAHGFPEELTRQCLRIVYPNSPTLWEQATAGNIERHSLAMQRQQWQQLLELLQAPQPINPGA